MNISEQSKGVGQRIERARKRNNPEVTQAQLANLVGLTQAQISRLEKGLTKGTPKIVDIADALGVNVYWLQTGNGLIETKDTMIDKKLKRLRKTIEMLDLDEHQLDMIINDAIIQATKMI